MVHQIENPTAKIEQDRGEAMGRSHQSLRSSCTGLSSLDAKLEDWMVSLLQTGDDCESPLFHELENRGSPLNVLSTIPFLENVNRFKSIAAAHKIDFEVYFARKANKCLSFVDASKTADCGIDVASLPELQQVLARGSDSSKIICTAAVKSKELIQTCAQEDVVIAVDNLDELSHVLDVAKSSTVHPRIALRISGFHVEGQKLFSRFGFDIDSVVPEVQSAIERNQDSSAGVRIVGIHFHLDGYCHRQRVAAITQSVALIDDFRSLGHPIEFLDMGGGIPMSYLEHQTQWETFWSMHRQALLGKRSAVTYRNHGLGLRAHDGSIIGPPNSYPYFQEPIAVESIAETNRKGSGDGKNSRFAVQTAWLQAVLTSDTNDLTGDISTVATTIRSRGLQLRCEPGRSLLDGCGMTIAKVEFRKRHPDGHWLIGLAMNHTHCLTSSDDFLVDPILIRGLKPGKPQQAGDVGQTGRHQPMEGFLVGAYCTESELLCKRRLRFPNGINHGDKLVFPNTAGYLMHFLESRSHQFPLAKNIFASSSNAGSFHLDDIDHKVEKSLSQ